jgi:hypothetical protein
VRMDHGASCLKRSEGDAAYRMLCVMIRIGSKGERGAIKSPMMGRVKRDERQGRKEHRWRDERAGGDRPRWKRRSEESGSELHRLTSPIVYAGTIHVPQPEVKRNRIFRRLHICILLSWAKLRSHNPNQLSCAWLL